MLWGSRWGVPANVLLAEQVTFGFIEGFRADFVLTAQVGPLRFVEGSPHHNAAIFGCHYDFAR
jgi:hypothetical protein